MFARQASDYDATLAVTVRAGSPAGSAQATGSIVAQNRASRDAHEGCLASTRTETLRGLWGLSSLASITAVAHADGDGM